MFSTMVNLIIEADQLNHYLVIKTQEEVVLKSSNVKLDIFYSIQWKPFQWTSVQYSFQY